VTSDGDNFVDAGEPPTQPLSPQRTAQVGATLAERYRLGRCIAVGGMGSVWEAQDLRLDRRVAVKLPADDLARGLPDHVARFAREATAAGRLAHPNVATVHDHGYEGFTPFIVMELLQGETLAERIRRGPVPEDEAVQIAGQVAAALDAAHDAGIVHRDVKPANIMLTPGGVKVMDFGVASAEWTQTITTAGMLGTAAYLSPEQARGEPAVPASDVYSLGVVVFEMLAGRPPFVADTQVAVVAAHVHRDPPPLADLAPDTSDHVVRAIESALAKDPADRPPTPSALARMLEDAEPTVPVPAPAGVAAFDETGLMATPSLTEPIADEEPTSVFALAPSASVEGPSEVEQRRRWWWGAAAALLVVLALAAWAWAADDGIEDAPASTTTEVTVATATVPDVMGQPVDAAIGALRGAGLEVGDVVTAEGAEGVVIGIDPVVGAIVEPGATVTLTVGDGVPPAEADDDEGPGEGRGNDKEDGDGKGKGDD
jgi:eukaryotic-like serine/threonine-protein kinase